MQTQAEHLSVAFQTISDRDMAITKNESFQQDAECARETQVSPQKGLHRSTSITKNVWFSTLANEGKTVT